MPRIFPSLFHTSTYPPAAPPSLEFIISENKYGSMEAAGASKYGEFGIQWIGLIASRAKQRIQREGVPIKTNKATKMAGASRLLRTSRALQSDHHPPFSSSSSNPYRLPCPKFLTRGGAMSFLPQGRRGGKSVAVSPGTTVTSPERKHEPSFFEKGMEIVDLSSSRIGQVAKLALTLFVPSRQKAPRGFCSAHSEMLVETVLLLLLLLFSHLAESISSAFSSPICLLQAGNRWMSILHTNRGCRIPDRPDLVFR